MIVPHFVPTATVHAFGPVQFAYRKEHGARDALALHVAPWLLALNEGLNMPVDCSEVCGAFDRVSAVIILKELRLFYLQCDLLALIEQCLRDRPAYVVVGCSKSERVSLRNMVFLCTVWL